MEPVSAHNGGDAATALRGELIVQNGRHRGMRRTLGQPTTFLGKANYCDVRFNAAEVSPNHCVVIHSGTQLLLRDLDSVTGTFVNGKRISQQVLRDGDELTIGPFQFLVHLAPAEVSGPVLLPAPGEDMTAREREALRIQVAAVAAQQAAMTEWELRLSQRQATLEQQQAQLAAHLEEKRQKLIELQGQVQTSRQELQKERDEHQRRAEAAEQQLTERETAIQKQQQESQTQHQRLLKLQAQTKKRFVRHLREQRRQAQTRQAELDRRLQETQREKQALQQERSRLAEQTTRFNSEMELGRRQLHDRWLQLRAEEKQVRQQLSQQRQQAEQQWNAAVEREERVLAAEKLLRKEKDKGRRYLQGLHIESQDLDGRIVQQRRTLREQQQEIQRLQEVVQVLRQSAQPIEVLTAADTLSEPAAEAAADSAVVAVPAAPPASAEPAAYPLVLIPMLHSALVASGTLAPAAPAEVVSESQTQLQELDQLADELRDQRAQLAEQWHLLLQTKAGWEEMHRQAADDVRLLAEGLHERALVLMQREDQLRQTAETQLQQQQELLRLRHQLVGWQARLRSSEMDWQKERDQLHIDLEVRREQIAVQVQSLDELRQHWVEVIRSEVDALQTARESWELAAKQYVSLCEDRRQQIHLLQEEHRAAATKSLAIEQYRQECLTSASDAVQADRRIERLRQRWEKAQRVAGSAAEQQMADLRQEMEQLQRNCRELQAQLLQRDAEKLALIQRRTDWEEQQRQTEAEQAQLRQQLHALHAQQQRSELALSQLQAELDRIARQLLDEPASPVLAAFAEEAEASHTILDRAA